MSRRWQTHLDDLVSIDGIVSEAVDINLLNYEFSKRVARYAKKDTLLFHAPQ